MCTLIDVPNYFIFMQPLSLNSLALAHALPHEDEDCDSMKKQDSMENNQRNAMDNQQRNNQMEDMNRLGQCDQGNLREEPQKKIWTLGVGRAWPPFEEL